MEVKSIKGQVQEKTENSIKINKLWIKFFDAALLMGINQGDNVEVKYQDNVKNDKVYHNAKEIKKLTYNTEIKEYKSLDPSTINTIIMSAKELKIAYLNRNEEKPFKDIIKEILDGLSEQTIKIRTE
jgi:hypothetical protein